MRDIFDTALALGTYFGSYLLLLAMLFGFATCIVTVSEVTGCGSSTYSGSYEEHGSCWDQGAQW